TAGGDASASNTDESVIGSLSARGRLRIGAAALWLGADLRARAAPQSLGSPVDVELPPVSVLVSAGELGLVAGAADWLRAVLGVDAAAAAVVREQPVIRRAREQDVRPGGGVRVATREVVHLGIVRIRGARVGAVDAAATALVAEEVL